MEGETRKNQHRLSCNHCLFCLEDHKHRITCPAYTGSCSWGVMFPVKWKNYLWGSRGHCPGWGPILLLVSEAKATWTLLATSWVEALSFPVSLPQYSQSGECVCWCVYLEDFGSRHQAGQSRGQCCSKYTSSDERGEGWHHAYRLETEIQCLSSWEKRFVCLQSDLMSL